MIFIPSLIALFELYSELPKSQQHVLLLASLLSLLESVTFSQPPFCISSVLLETRARETKERARGEKVLSPGGGKCLNRESHKVRNAGVRMHEDLHRAWQEGRWVG